MHSDVVTMEFVKAFCKQHLDFSVAALHLAMVFCLFLSGELWVGEFATYGQTASAVVFASQMAYLLLIAGLTVAGACYPTTSRVRVRFLYGIIALLCARALVGAVYFAIGAALPATAVSNVLLALLPFVAGAGLWLVVQNCHKIKQAYLHDVRFPSNRTRHQ